MTSFNASKSFHALFNSVGKRVLYNQLLKLLSCRLQECEKIRQSIVMYNEDETAVKCHAIGPDGCGGDQTSDGKGCKINGCDFGELNESSLTIEAICCKEALNNWSG